MRLAALTFISALAVGAVAVNAAPLAPNLDTGPSPNIVQVWGGGGWVPPHCRPNYGYYGGGYPYRYRYRHWWGY